jgi:hypothetical protein
MQNSRLVEIFQKLDKKELRELGKFVQSPFHNQREDVILLYDYLLKFVKSKKTIAIDKENVFSYLYPNEVYSEKKIRYTISFFFKVVKDFLAYQEFILERVNQQVFLLKSLRKKNTERLFEQEFRKAEHNLESDSLRNQQFHFVRFLLQEEKYSYALRNSRGANTGLQESSESLNLFFIANVLRQETHGLTQKALGQSDFKSAFLPAIEQYLSKNKHLESPAILVYYELIKVLTTGNSLSTFQSLRKLISENGHHFPPNELREIYIFALNYCIKKINAREALFNREAFEIYKQGILQGVFIENGILSRFNYKNIVAAGLSVQEFDWVQHFIEKYKPYLEKKYRESTYNYNLAMLFYRKENYSEAMLLLQKVSSDDVLNNLNSRRMLVRIYYDQQEFDALYSLLDSFQNYIYRKRDIGYQKHLYLNLIKFMRKLLQIEGYSTAQIEALRKEIENTKNVAEKVWLLEKLDR